MRDVIQLINRFEYVLKCVRNQNSGQDIHTIGNIRNMATSSIQLLEDGSMGYDEGYQICLRLEHQVTKFFQTKYAYAYKGHSESVKCKNQ